MDNINEAVEAIKTYCAKFKHCRDGCRFYDEDKKCKFQGNCTPTEEWEFHKKETEE